jgi:hypothetical protein
MRVDSHHIRHVDEDAFMAITVWLLRPDDLLNLRIEGSNLRLDTADATAPVLVVDDPQQPAYLIVEFPPQSIAEGAYYEAAVVAADGAPPGRTDPDQPTTPPASDQLIDTPVRPGHLAAGQKTVAQVGGTSRLVFRVPNDWRMPYTTAGLLDWAGLTLSVNPIAAIGPDPTPEQIASAPAIRAPASRETAIELPRQLLISPTDAVDWDHRFAPFFHAGQCELWHTRMFAKAADGAVAPALNVPIPLRAIWTDGFNATHPLAPPEHDPALGRVALSPRDRSQIVALTSAFHGYAADYQVFAGLLNFQALAAGGVSMAGGLRRLRRPRSVTQGYVPQPFFAEQLFLSPLGGWLKSRGSWDPLPYTTVSTPPKGWNFAEQITELGPLIRHAGQPIALGASRVSVLNEHVADLLERSVRNPPQTKQQLDLSEWIHLATQGRDHYVRIVYEGELWPFRHKAALIKVTERKFLAHDGIVEAHLVQRNFIVVRQPEVAFADSARAIPFKQVQLTTKVTPSIAEPVPIDNGLPAGDANYRATHRSFWVEVMTGAASRQKFPFHGVGRDIAGGSVDFSVPMLFVSVSDLADPANMALVRDAYNALSMLEQRSVRIPGQPLTFAPARAGPAPANDNTRLAARTLNFVVNAAGDAPRMLLAEVNIPAIQQLLNTDAPTTIRYFQRYLDEGIDAAANPTGVFAEVVKQAPGSYTPQSPFDGLVADTLGVAFSSDKAGGFATPDMGVSCLSSALGSLAGDVAKAAGDTFDPSGFFPPGGLARIFGSFDLADLLSVSTHGQNAPKIQTESKDIPGGKLLTVKLDWKPEIHNVDLGIAAFEKDHGGATVLDIHGTIQKPLQFDHPAADADITANFTGTLDHFRISILAAVHINFALFSFTANAGQKADITVNLDAATPLEFAGDLKFVEELRKAIPAGLFGDGPSLDLSPTGIRAGFELALPPLAVGVFALKDVALGAALTLPFVDGKPVFDFNVSQRCHPFQLAIAFFAGGGFFHLQLDTAGIKQLEAALEFGAAAAIDIGVASGEVHIMAGIYFALQRKEGQTELSCTLAGYLRMGGSLSVLGLVKISVEFNLTFAYQSEPGGSGKAYGRATLTVQVEVLMFSKSVELTVEKAFGGSNGDPKFLDAFDTEASWNAYALAFA